MTEQLPKTSVPPFRLGEIEVLPASNELRGRRGVQRVRPLLMDVLLRLAREPGVVVRRETLLEEVWPRRMVNDEVLSRAIAELRTALGDDAREARYVETIPKVGYRLVARVEPLHAATGPEASPASHPAPAAAPAPAAMPAANPAPRPSRIPVIAALAIAGLGAALAATWLLQGRRAEPAAGLEARLLQARPFTSDPGIEVGPRLSPDGRRVAYASAEAGRSRIVLQDLDGGSRMEIAAGAGEVVQSPVFFPDGQRIAFLRARLNGCEIVEMRLADRAERRIADCSLSPRPRFDVSPDGRSIVASGRRRAQFPLGLWLIDTAGGEPRELTAPEPGAGDDVYPRFSPDGKRIAFFRGGDSHRRAYALRLDDPAAAAPLSKHEGLVYGLAWIGRDGPLLVATDWLGFRALGTLDPATGAARTVGARGARFPDVGAGGVVVYENAIYSANLWRLDPASSSVAPVGLFGSTRYTSQPEISPDGRSIAFASNREGMDAVYVAPLDGAPRRIGGADEVRYMRPRWAADGRSVLAVRTTHDAAGQARQQAVRITLDGTATPVPGLGGNVVEVRETRDGRHLVWAENAGHALRLLRAPSDRIESAERLPVPLVSFFQLNSTHLVFTQPQLPGLTRCRLADFSCAPMELALPESDLFHWALTERSIYRRVREGGTVRLERRSLADLKVTGRWDARPGGAASSIAASADDSVLVFAREEEPAIDLMLARP